MKSDLTTLDVSGGCPEPRSRIVIAVTQFLAIATWEIRYYLRRASTWGYFGAFFALAFVYTLADGGAVGEFATGARVLRNSPYALGTAIPLIALFGVSVTAALAGSALYKDYEANSASLFYALPINRAAFFGGRFAGTLVVNVVVSLGIGLGCMAAVLSPWMHANTLDAFHAMSYVQPYVTLVLPNFPSPRRLFASFISRPVCELCRRRDSAARLPVAGSLATISTTSDSWRCSIRSDCAQAAVTQYGRSPKEQRIPLSGLPFELADLACGCGNLRDRRIAFSIHVHPRRPRFATGLRRRTSRSVATRVPGTPGCASTVTALDAAGRWIQFRRFDRAFWQIIRNRYFAAIAGAGVL